MKTLVLGGTRFVGRRLVEALLAAGHDVAVLNRGTHPPVPATETLRADRHAKGEVAAALAGREFDAAFDVSAYKPEETAKVVEALVGRVGRFVHISTGAVYDKRAGPPWREDSPRGPLVAPGDYGSDKARCENLLFEAHAAREFPAVVLRPPYVYGPHDYLYREAYFFDRAEAGRAIPVPEGAHRVQFVHVDDLAVTTILAAERQGAEGEAFNVGAEELVTFEELARMAARAVGVEATVVAVAPSRKLAALFPFAPFAIELDGRKARAVLGARFRPLGQGLEDTYQWYGSARPFGAPDFSQDDKLLGRSKGRTR